MVLTLTSGAGEFSIEPAPDGSIENDSQSFVQVVRKLYGQYMLFSQPSYGPLMGTDRTLDIKTNSSGTLYWSAENLPPALRASGTHYVVNVTPCIATGDPRRNHLVTWSNNLSSSGGVNVRVMMGEAGSDMSYQGVGNLYVVLWYVALAENI